MLKDKIKGLVKSRNKRLLDCFEPFGVTSQSSMTIKLSRNSISLFDMIRLSEHLGCELVVRDKETKEVVAIFDDSDLQ